MPKVEKRKFLYNRVSGSEELIEFYYRYFAGRLYARSPGVISKDVCQDMLYTIREATAADIPRMVEIIRKAFYDVAVRFGLTEGNCPKHPSNCKVSWIKEALEKGARYFILDAEGLSCGCVALEPASPEVCYLERLGVLPAQRRRGYGRALVDRVLYEAKVIGSHRVDIGIIADHVELKDWYRRMGFVGQKTATFAHLPFEVLFMSMVLEPLDKSRRNCRA